EPGHRRRPGPRTDLLQQASSCSCCVAAKLYAPVRAGKQARDIAEFGHNLSEPSEPNRIELQHHIAAFDMLAGTQVADPVVGKVRADQEQLARTKRAYGISDDVAACAAAD